MFGQVQSEIGAEIGVSQMQVCRIIRHAVSRLQEEVERFPPNPLHRAGGTQTVIAGPARTRGIPAPLR